MKTASTLRDEMIAGLLALNDATGKHLGINRWLTTGARVDGGNLQRYQIVERVTDALGHVTEQPYSDVLYYDVLYYDGLMSRITRDIAQA
jgi:hypothetical protein